MSNAFFSKCKHNIFYTIIYHFISNCSLPSPRSIASSSDSIRDRKFSGCSTNRSKGNHITITFLYDAWTLHAFAWIIIKKRSRVNTDVEFARNALKYFPIQFFISTLLRLYHHPIIHLLFHFLLILLCFTYSEVLEGDWRILSLIDLSERKKKNKNK